MMVGVVADAFGTKSSVDEFGVAVQKLEKMI